MRNNLVNTKLEELIKQKNILSEHNDGGCYKLIIEYTDYEEPVPFDAHVKWCEDFEDLLEYGLAFRDYQNDLGRVTIDFRIQDDSK